MSTFGSNRMDIMDLLGENFTSNLSALLLNAPLNDDNIFAARHAATGEDGDPEQTLKWSFPVSFEFIVHGVLLCCVGMGGLFGNIISIIILSRPQMKSSINTILIGLVAFDSILIITSLFMFSFTVFRHTGSPIFQFYYWEIYPYILSVVYPVGMVAQTGSINLTLSVTIERYLVVCWPLKARAICTNGRAKLSVFFFTVFAVIYNIPRFFEVTWETQYLEDFGENRTVIAVTDFRKSALYIKLYISWMYLVFMYIIPFVSLAVLNLMIFLEIRKANVTRSILSNQEKKEHNLAVMLLVVVFIFFICNILPLILNIIELFHKPNPQVIQVSNLLVTINSSVNILIYCIFGNKFKTIFLQIFCGKKPHIQQMRTCRDFRRNQYESGSMRSTTMVEPPPCHVRAKSNLTPCTSLSPLYSCNSQPASKMLLTSNASPLGRHHHHHQLSGRTKSHAMELTDFAKDLHNNQNNGSTSSSNHSSALRLNSSFSCQDTDSRRGSSRKVRTPRPSSASYSHVMV
ncbi:hypothetical protein TCAL_05489 [Tigriopus californicus]|uniref:G-protein coupled receptors family 1 profile domain-containing protein n=1 Tax=Tigriopus californicus TaxID=6832 RepID=A0A553NNZ9_TIGCA|nr:FMRFamide receptor-like [Tigriopus californicus]TRY67168.1 hypothetical protein TCAL_05489 [Tigriopus californicus]